MLAIRPRTWPASIAPVLVGWGIAIYIDKFYWLPALATLLVGLMIQIGANLVNDVADFKKGADTIHRLGPTRVTQAGLLSPREVWVGAILVFLIAGLAGLYLAITSGWILILLGAACILAAVIYTVGPFSLAYNGLGDLFAILFFGFAAVCGTTFAISHTLPTSALLCSLGVGALVANILDVNNIRDIETDRVAGRRNIPVVLGRRAAELEYAGLLITAYSVTVLLFLTRQVSWPGLLPLLSVPHAYQLYRKICKTPASPAFNPLLAATAQLTLIYSMLTAAGFILSRLF
jgi:1,4-dihydroxy-2-naphthoate octaprenyltransferase